jgi:hypothetical protein
MLIVGQQHWIGVIMEDDRLEVVALALMLVIAVIGLVGPLMIGA